jgi:hypothetical protein
MQKLLLILLLFFSQSVFAQRGFLYVKKKGYKKVRTFEEGGTLKFETKDDLIIYGELAQVKKDSIYVNNNWFATANIKTLFLREGHYHFDSKTFLLTTAGVVLATAGMTLAGWTDFEHALAYSASIGYGNFLILNFPSLKRKKYKIGKKFALQTFDLHF